MARRNERRQIAAMDAEKVFHDFITAVERDPPSPPGGDKSLVANWTEARGTAMILKEKTIHLRSVREVRLVALMKSRYGFDGTIVIDKSIVGDDTFQLMISTAISGNLKGNIVTRAEFLDLNQGANECGYVEASTDCRGALEIRLECTILRRTGQMYKQKLEHICDDLQWLRLRLLRSILELEGVEGRIYYEDVVNSYQDICPETN